MCFEFGKFLFVNSDILLKFKPNEFFITIFIQNATSAEEIRALNSEGAAENIGNQEYYEDDLFERENEHDLDIDDDPFGFDVEQWNWQ